MGERMPDSDRAAEPNLAGDARETNRHVVDGPLRSNLGKVIDLSPSGALVVSRAGALDGIIAFAVADSHGSLHCAARVVWTRRCGLFRYETGLAFSDLSPEQLATIRRLIEAHSLRSEYGYPERREAA